MEADNLDMIIKVWGNRGSIPSPLRDEEVLEKHVEQLFKTVERIKANGIKKVFGQHNPTKDSIRHYLIDSFPKAVIGTYGGDTTCIEIQARNSPLQVVDLGTGAREAGRAISKRIFSKDRNLNPLNSAQENKNLLDVWLSHYHWDHIQGIPFFEPVLMPYGTSGIAIKFHGKKLVRRNMKGILKGQQQEDYFPVAWENIPAKVSYDELPIKHPKLQQKGQLKVTYQEMRHPRLSLSYAFEINKKKFVFATDNEVRGQIDSGLVELARNAEIMYMDAQYLPEEYAGGDPKLITGKLPKKGWGHNTYEFCVLNALAADVKLLVLGHHEPIRSDKGLDELQSRAMDYRDSLLLEPPHLGKKLQVMLSYQGMELRL